MTDQLNVTTIQVYSYEKNIFLYTQSSGIAYAESGSIAFTVLTKLLLVGSTDFF